MMTHPLGRISVLLFLFAMGKSGKHRAMHASLRKDLVEKFSTKPPFSLCFFLCFVPLLRHALGKIGSENRRKGVLSFMLITVVYANPFPSALLLYRNLKLTLVASVFSPHNGTALLLIDEVKARKKSRRAQNYKNYKKKRKTKKKTTNEKLKQTKMKNENKQTKQNKTKQ